MLNKHKRPQPSAYQREIVAGHKFGSNGEGFDDVDYEKEYTQEELVLFYSKFMEATRPAIDPNSPYRVIHLNPCYSD